MTTQRERVIQHVRTHFGEPRIVHLQDEDDEPRIELLFVDRPHGQPYTLVVTFGMSAQPMPADDGFEEPERYRHAELCMLLPPSWPDVALQDPEEYLWPFSTLIQCAQIPQLYAGRLWVDHTVFQGPRWPGTNLSSVLVAEPHLFAEDTRVIPGDPETQLFQLVPITRKELAWKVEHGAVSLIDELFDYDPQVFGAIEPQRRCAFDETGPLRDVEPTELPPPTTDIAWLVIPARRARSQPALDRLLEIAARAHDATELRVRVATCTDGTRLILVRGATLVKLAQTLGVVDNRIAALRLLGTRGAARLYRDGAEVEIVRGSDDEALAAVAAHVGSTPDALRSVSGATAETRVVHWTRPDTPDPEEANISWDTDIDATVEIEVCESRLATHSALILDRFGVWRRALARQTKAVEEHETMQDNDTRGELHRAERAIRDAYDELIHVLLTLDDRPLAILYAALERVLDAGGVPAEYAASLRQYPRGVTSFAA